MSRRKTTRFRKGDVLDTPEVTPIPTDSPSAEPASTSAEPASTPPAPVPPAATPAAPAPTPRLAQDDLQALMDMDPAELASLMEGASRSTQLEVGSQIRGAVARITQAYVFVDIGGKSEGIIDRSEVPDVVLGEEVEAFVLTVDHEGVQLSKQLSGAAAAEHIEEARESGIPVEGRVIRHNPGGFEVKVGGVRAFCPISRISRLPELSPEEYVGQTLQFRVIETGDKIVLSRRALQEEEAEAKAEEIWRTLSEGDNFRGVVRNVQPFGVFVDIGGLDGLIPRRELGWGDNDTGAVAPGQTISVHVLEVDREARRITLSARNLADDPWTQVGTTFFSGEVYPGTVVRVQPFGAFIELAGGLQGLAHISKLAGGPPQVGTQLHVRILEVDYDRRRLALAPVSDVNAPAAEEGEEVQGTVSQVLNNGVVVQLADGRTGWLAAREVELPAGTVMAQRFRVGKPVTARAMKSEGDRVSLSMREDPGKADAAWRTQVTEKKSGSFGTLADLLGGLKLDK